jgi:2-polyprenyl-3-methyl-5-hydroxy-6-metoxy-1,4-benzoquinol methylase
MREFPTTLACPDCRAALDLDCDVFRCQQCGRAGQWREGVWDFVLGDDYADSFARQWSKYRSTQLDSANGTTISRDQFRLVTGWLPEDLAGQSVLDAGCGAGRYAEIALSTGASVTGLDLSGAAYVAHANLRDRYPDFTVVRGDILKPPLKSGAFDKVYSIGVVQSTPDPLAVARSLMDLTRPGGELAIWMYERRWYSPMLPKYVLRRFTRHLPASAAARFSSQLVGGFTPIARSAGRLPSAAARRVARTLLPIASYWGELPLDDAQQREWSELDTHDWLTPAYDLPQRFAALRVALMEAGAVEVRRSQARGLGVLATRRGGDSS